MNKEAVRRIPLEGLSDGMIPIRTFIEINQHMKQPPLSFHKSSKGLLLPNVARLKIPTAYSEITQFETEVDAEGKEEKQPRLEHHE